MIDKMTKYTFILPAGEVEGFISYLQGEGVVDVTRSLKAVDDKSTALLERSARIKEAMGILSAVEIPKGYEPSGDFPVPADPVEEIFSTRDGIRELSSRLEGIRTDIKWKEHWGSYDSSALDSLCREKGLKVRYYKTSVKRFDPLWAEQVPLFEVSRDGSNVYFVTISGDEDYSFPLAECPPAGGSLDSSIALEKETAAELEKRQAKLASLTSLRDTLERMLRENTCDLDKYFTTLGTQSAVEGTIGVIVGFVPSDSTAHLEDTLREQPVYYYKDDATVEDAPPIKLRNNSFVKMFEVLTDMYGRPAYDGFDPTVFISIFFLLFFAFCMGDCGYGIILIILGFLLRKVPSFKSLSPLVVTLGIGTAVIGFLFHTFFSIDISGWEWIPSPLRAIMLPGKIMGYDGTMILAIIVGIVHLSLAMLVKAINETRNKGLMNSLSSWGWSLLFTGGAITGGLALIGVLDKGLTKTIIIAIGALSAVGIFLLNNPKRNIFANIGAGLWDTYNSVTGLLGDVLSYLRLYALGLAGSMLGLAFNQIALQVLGDGKSPLLWVGFILIAVVGHTLNIAMAALGAFVHPLRLNFLEFFKNSGYDPAGRTYTPLTTPDKVKVEE